jgi:putative membrane protein
MNFFLRLIINALGVLAAASLVPGIEVANFGTALLVALILGILNAVVGWPLKILTLPLSLATLGFFLLVINGLMFWMATFVKGFAVHGFWAAFFGSLIVTAVNLLGKALLKDSANARQ